MTLTERMKQFQAQCIREYLAQADGSSTKAAKIAGMNRTAFIKLMATHGITTPRNPLFRGNAAWQQLDA